LTLVALGYDGTRVRANNRRSGTRTPDQLRQMREELAEKFRELDGRVSAADAEEDAALGVGVSATLPAELADVRRRLSQVDAALAELARAEAAGETSPKRVPLTDPQSRLTPNKEGGFAPNYTPLATVDVASGLIVAQDVIGMTNEEHYLTPQIQAVQRDFNLPAPPPEMLADGMMRSGANLQALEAMGVTLYTSVPLPDPATNPALRDDPTQPVPAEQYDRLPTQAVKNPQGQTQRQLTKEAFVYDASRDCYWCPAGQALAPEQTTSERSGAGGTSRSSRTRYKASAEACAACALKARCVQGQAPRREISRYEHEPQVEALQARMATPAAQEKYARRREVCERPFAVIKHQYGARRFLLRSLKKVRVEWCWLTTAFNLDQLMSLLRRRAASAAPIAAADSTIRSRAGPSLAPS
jgi:Transposase DDE domain